MLLPQVLSSALAAGSPAETMWRHIRFPLRPLFSLLMVLALGIVVATAVPLPILPLLVAMALLLIASVRLSRRSAALGAGCLLLVCALFGMVRTRQALQIGGDDVSRLQGGPSLWICGEVASAVDRRPSSFGGGDYYSFTLSVRGLDDYQDRRRVSGRLRVAVFAAPKPPRLGDVVWVRGRVEKPEAATNPGGFDYRAYLERQGVHATLVARRNGDLRFTASRATLPP
ncbi:MAG: DUF4131 domain-containing protein, partial [Cytophagales bacterium]|nr:DUF4131 domain-containing protein [Armatimonadota bacterium]